MRAIDLDRDMSDVFPTGATTDSEFLFRRMEEETYRAVVTAPGARTLDVAAGVGQDDHALARRGLRVAATEPSARMMGLARLADERQPAPAAGSVARVRAWGERLPFRDGAFDVAFCKGSLDHFDDPLAALAEMARVARGRVVVAVANFESLGCRLARWLERRSGASESRGRRHFDVPADHFTRYDRALVREHLGTFVHIEREVGVSLLWGLPGWSRLLARLGRFGRPLLGSADLLARRLPALADVIVLTGTPRLRPSTPAEDAD